MSVEIVVTRESRPDSLPCRESGQGGPTPVVTIRVGDRTFTSECCDMQEAAEVARRTASALARYYERPSTWPH